MFSVATLLGPVGLLNGLWAKKYPAINLPSDETIRTWLKQYHVPAVGIGLIEGAKLKTVKVYGELSKGIAAPHNTIWNVAGMGNVVIALTVLKLADKGIWNLDDPLSASPQGTAYTTRMLLSQQLNYNDIAGALARKFGKDLQQLYADEIFKPLGMCDSCFTDSDMSHSPRFARPHNGKYGIYVSGYTHRNAAGYLMTTVEDYCRLCLYVLKRAHFRPQPVHGLLGFNIIQNLPHGEFALTQNAAGNGITAFTLLLPRSKRGIVIFTNGDNGKLLEECILKNSGTDAFVLSGIY